MTASLAPLPSAPAALRVGPALSPLAAPEESWTLGQTLDAIARHGATLRLASTGVKLAHGHRLPALARQVARHADALALWLRLGGDAGTRAVAPGWDALTRLHAAWLLSDATPEAPLVLAPGVTATDGPRYRATVAARLALGPEAPGADGLRTQLAAAFDRYAVADAARVPSERTWAIAA